MRKQPIAEGRACLNAKFSQVVSVAFSALSNASSRDVLHEGIIWAGADTFPSRIVSESLIVPSWAIDDAGSTQIVGIHGRGARAVIHAFVSLIRGEEVRLSRAVCHAPVCRVVSKGLIGGCRAVGFTLAGDVVSEELVGALKIAAPVASVSKHQRNYGAFSHTCP